MDIIHSVNYIGTCLQILNINKWKKYNIKDLISQPFK